MSRLQQELPSMRGSNSSVDESVDLLGLEESKESSSNPNTAPQRGSLLDTVQEEDEEDTLTKAATTTRTGGAGFLEMEEVEIERPRSSSGQRSSVQNLPQTQQQTPIKTTSGLLLTHRSSPLPTKRHYTPQPPQRRDPQRFEMDHDDYKKSQGLPLISQAKGILTIARLGIVLWAMAIVAGTMVVVSHVKHERKVKQQEQQNNNNQEQQSKVEIISLTPEFNPQEIPDQIILRPFPHHGPRRLGQTTSQKVQAPKAKLASPVSLWQEFEEWAVTHNKKYHNQEEKKRRFHIWSKANERIHHKNERHGPCKLTKQPVFGHNHLSDLTHEEFQSQFLNYAGPTTDALKENHSVGVMGPHIPIQRHEEVHRRFEETTRGRRRLYSSRGTELASCKWYNVSCLLRYFFETYFYGLGGVMEPKYDEDSYPSSVDWREMGAVTQVRSQGNCGACKYDGSSVGIFPDISTKHCNRLGHNSS